ncbi:ATPase [Caulobacter segnis]|uniref:Activator of Hsp90 ATPase 1 family protein n=2 Tax=Caulobacter segnis TaxID=88688 RepID=D5VFR6_CAUST|nr:SRPBCC family protein [Caulobacter segnis]ADG09798.1 Activator of Hsp90 ATPase 1 family protein [Caulobacter segnis ATCC 21756]AVQ01564.1 ATPase [Caulobacter segnis]
MSAKNETVVTRKSDRELVVTRLFNGPARIVFEAWSKPELFQRWWVPKTLGVPLRACEMDVRTGGGYRLEFGLDAANAMAFYGKYTEVTPHSKIVWTNEEGGEISVTTVTFEDRGGQTLLTLSELYPSKEACDEAIQGSAAGLPGQFEQLDALLVELVA